MGEKTEHKTPRAVWVDHAKALAMVAVVYGHTVQTGAANRYVYSFHVPLFFFLLGVVFSITRGEEKPFGDFIKKRAYSLMLPYYCFAVLSTAVIFLASRVVPALEAEIFANPLDLIKNLFIGDCIPNRPLWFLPCTFVLSVLAWAVLRLINRLEAPASRLWAMAVLGGACAIALILTEAFTRIRFLPFKADGAVFMLPFFLAGYAMDRFSGLERIRHLPAAPRFMLMAVLLAGGAWLGLVNGKPDYRANYYDHPGLMYLSALATCVGISMLAQYIPRCPALSYVGRHTLGILLLHKFPVLVFQKVIPLTAGPLERGSAAVGLVVTGVCIALCCGAEYILARLTPWAVGRGLPEKEE